MSQQCTCDTIRAIGWCPVHRPPPTRDAERRAATLRARLAEVERECTDARATLSHVNKALGYPVDVNKWDDVESAGLMLVDAIRKSRERHDSAIEELRRVTLDRDAKKERADKADQARDAANAVNADMGSQMCRIRAALDSKPGTWRQMADSIARDRDALAAEIVTLTARVEHYKRACITTSAEVTRVLGEALYGPNPDAWSTHTPEAIADEAASEIATLRAENERMRGEIITYQDAHTTGTEIIDELRAKVEALEPSDDVIELIRVAIDPDEPRLSGSCRAMVDVWLNRVSAARKGGE